MSALQRAIEQRGLKIHSRAAIDHLLQTRLDENERWDRGDGRGPHGEDVILLGIASYLLERAGLPTAKANRDRLIPQQFANLTQRVNGQIVTLPVERW
jgi:hypothetical protein